MTENIDEMARIKREIEERFAETAGITTRSSSRRLRERNFVTKKEKLRDEEVNEP